MSNTFSRLHESLQQVLSQRLGWTEIRDVQARAYAAVISGNDVLVIAPTAGGKSEAALIPIMDDILKNGRCGVNCIYISPLKALINDQEERFRAFCVPTSLSVMKWHGDLAKGERTWPDGEPPHFLMITPESLEVVLQGKEYAKDLRQVRTIIIDELHAFVESDRGVQMKVLLDRMDILTQRKIQRIGLSATTGNPEEVLAWLSENRQGRELVAISSPPKEKQFRFTVEPEYEGRIEALVRIVRGKKALVFVNSRSEAEKIAKAVSGRIRNLHIHHSSLAPVTRKAAEDAFSSPDGACIICTSTLELGIDIGSLDIVVQIGCPDTVSSFLQRTGRAGRRDGIASVAWILRNSCELLCSVAIIECAVKREVEDLTPPKKPYNVLLQQIFLYLHTHSRVTRRQVFSALHSHPPFRGIEPEVFDAILSHLVNTGYITPDGEVIMPGPEAERQFGRSNWKELYSVITGGEEYRAVTPEGEMVGKLDARFVNSNTDSVISLGGRDWSMVKTDEGHNIVVLVPSGSGRSRIFWTGSEAAGFSPIVCRMIQRIHSRGGSILPLGEAERTLIAEALHRIPDNVGADGLYVTSRKGTRGGVDVQIFSLSGSRFNRLLAYLLRHHLGNRAQVRYNDLLIRVQRPGRVVGTVCACAEIQTALESVRLMSYEKISRLLPLPRTESWKFAPAIPVGFLHDMVVSDYYHADDFMEVFTRLKVTVLEVPDPGGA
ncbi:MAG: ATP-dependent RNA helicase DbpA [Methanoregula sp. SKADARSKE-2]|nr:MAG: ATP-dependent RNA helicase DbpA [Methanoregula sp. SKADARSKE-2]